jgi:hypothetical protein
MQKSNTNCVPSRQTVRTATLLTAALLLTICPACSNGRFPVQGEVTFNGKAIDDGTISFEPVDGNGPTTGGKITAGKYQLTGDAAPVPGKKTVRIFAVRKTGRKIADQLAPKGTMIDDVAAYIPDIYNGRSTLACDVVPGGPNVADFHLKAQ